MFTSNIRIGKKCDLSDFDRGMIVDARQGALCICGTANLLGFSRTTVSEILQRIVRKTKNIQRAAVLQVETHCL